MTETTATTERYAANAYRLAGAALIARAALGAEGLAPQATRQNAPPDSPAPFPTEERAR